MLLARRAGALLRHLKRAAAGEPRAIHQARVASRRLREALPILAAGLDGVKAGKTRRRVRRLTRALGPVRELDVTIGLVDELSQRGTLPRVALEDVRAQIVSERDRRLAAASARLSRLGTDTLSARLARFSDALEASAREGWRHRLAARLARRAKRLQAAVERAGSFYDVERLHAVRIAVKQLRYALEIADETGAASARAHLRALKRAQTLLGRLHDLQVLQAHVAAVQAGAPASRAAGSRLPARDEGLSVLERAVEGECRHLHARYVAGAPALAATADAVSHDVVPDVARPSRRALKMPLPRAAGRGGRSGRRHAGTDRI